MSLVNRTTYLLFWLVGKLLLLVFAATVWLLRRLYVPLLGVGLWLGAATQPRWRLVFVLAAVTWIGGHLLFWHHKLRADEAEDRLDRWCRLLHIPEPDVLDWDETSKGERYYLRVTVERPDVNDVMTVAQFKALEGAIRDVIGDECRHVEVTPDRVHGGRCWLDIQWIDAEEAEEFEIRMTESYTARTTNAKEAKRLQAEADRWWEQHAADEDDDQLEPVHAGPPPMPHPQPRPAPHVPLPTQPTWGRSEPIEQAIHPTIEESGDGIEEPLPAPVGLAPVALLRPLNARPGTGAERLWQALIQPGEHPRSELIAASQLAPGTVDNALLAWARLGLAHRTDGGWSALVSDHSSAVS